MKHHQKECSIAAGRRQLKKLTVKRRHCQLLYETDRYQKKLLVIRRN